ncbi:MAG: ChaN family lipoprotein [Deltaproteobacteria bacterium]|nr:ChaN family lipoprotein [Deltaproteobacteria bacterium]
MKFNHHLKFRFFISDHFIFAGLFLIFALTGCSQSLPKATDPLLGKIIDSKTGKSLSKADLIGRLSGYEIIYLGEKHDNRHHHEIQEELIQDLIKLGKKPAIGIELFSVDQTGYLMEFVMGSSRLHQGLSIPQQARLLRNKLQWERRSDSEWENYFRFIKIARKHQLPLFGMDIPQGVVRRISSVGYENLSAVERMLAPRSNFNDPVYRDLMYRRFTEAHCGWSNPAHLKKLYQTWQSRNEMMAETIINTLHNNPKRPIVIILGGGHAENRMGVYERVLSKTNNLSQVTLGLTEIALNKTDLPAYLEMEQVGVEISRLPYDYLWFTPRAQDEDPCEKHKKILSKMKR